MSTLSLQYRAKAAYEEGSYLLDGATSPCGATVVASNSLKTVKAYKTDRLEFSGELRGHQGAIRDVRFSRADGNVLLSCGDGGEVFRWDVRTGHGDKLPLKLGAPDGLCSGDVSCDGMLVAVGDGCDIAVFDTRKLSDHPVILDGFHTETVSRVRFHDSRPDCLCSGGEDGLLIVSSLRDTASVDDACQWVFNYQNAINTISFTPDGERVVCTTSGESVHVGSLTTGDTLASYSRPEEWLYAIGPVGESMFWGINGEGYEARIGEIAVAPSLMTGEGASGWPCIPGGHSDLVRFALQGTGCSDGVVFTGGEDGFICAWSSTPTERTGHPTHSRVVPSVEALKGDEPAVFSSPLPAIPPADIDPDALVFTGECEVTVSPLKQHKARKAASRGGCKSPY